MTSHQHAARPILRTLLVAISLALAVWPVRSIADDAAIEPQETTSADSREVAQRELAKARAAVVQARAAATWAKADLEQAAEAQLDVQKAAGQDRSTAKTPAASDPAAKQTAGPGNPVIAKAAIQSLKQKIEDLKAERAELLAHVTAAHPLIEDADLRLEELSHELAVLIGSRTGAETLPAPAAAAAQADGDPERRDEAKARLQQALAKWESAQRQLQTAIDAEVAAAQRLAASGAHAPVSQSVQPTPVPSALTADVEPSALPTATAPAAAPAAPTSRPERHAGSQPLVLAALFVALVVAALASIKLARHTDASVFAGADDAAAALSLPVVGIIPALSGGARGTLVRRFPALVLLGQLLAAVVVFAAVAYCVQNPSFLWQLCTSPLETLRSAPR